MAKKSQTITKYVTVATTFKKTRVIFAVTAILITTAGTWSAKPYTGHFSWVVVIPLDLWTLGKSQSLSEPLRLQRGALEIKVFPSLPGVVLSIGDNAWHM